MNECITATTCHFTPAAGLAALGVVLEQRKVFEPIRAQVQIEQKTVKHTPLDKLYDSFITLLAGAHGLVAINTLLRADPSLQCAFGRKQSHGLRNEMPYLAESASQARPKKNTRGTKEALMRLR